jgi:hypothetical protein
MGCSGCENGGYGRTYEYALTGLGLFGLLALVGLPVEVHV